jgi:subtilisin family serine protease
VDPRLVRLFEQGGEGDEVAAILRFNAGAPIPRDVRVISRFGNIATVRLLRKDIPSVHDSPAVASLKPAAPLLREVQLASDGAAGTPTDRDARRSNRLPETGKGVVFGLIDWGFDFAHPDFRDATGATRLLALWDQSAAANASSPFPYGYGSVYTRVEINGALAAQNPYAALTYDPADSDTDGEGAHGTHVAGIAVGNGLSGGPSGIAPEADIVFVHLTTLNMDDPDLADSASVLEAIDFIRRIASPRPWVINLSMGQCGDQHDGTTLIEQGLDAALSEGPGSAIAQSVGNYFSSRQHSSGRLGHGERRTLNWRVPAGDASNELEVWYSGRDAFTVSLRAPGGALAGRAGLGDRAPLRVGGRTFGALHNRRRDPNNLDNHVVLWLNSGAPAGDWTVALEGSSVVDGGYHVWIQRGDDDGGGQAAFAKDQANPFFTTNSICNGRHTIVTGAYDPGSARREVASFCSSGPTRDGRRKPDLLAPGVGILSARSTPAGAPAGRGLQVRMTGTSMAAPHVAGTIALMFEAAPRPLRIEETRRLLLASARSVDRSPWESFRYGHGYLDTDAAVEAARELEGLEPRSWGETEMAPLAPRTTANGVKPDSWSGPLSMADTLVGLGGPFAVSPQALVARVLSDFADPATFDPAMAAGLFDPATLFDTFTTARLTHLRPLLDPLFGVVAYPRQLLAGTLQPGDLMLRRALGEPGICHAAFIAGQGAYPCDAAARRGLAPESWRPGLYARVVEAGSRPHRHFHRFARRIAGPDGRVPPDTLILRARLRRRVRGLAEDVDFNTAVPANRQYSAQLGWGARYDDIVALLGLSASPTEQAFAQAVSDWQSQHGLTADGMLGPDTWAAMQPFLGSAPGPAPTPPTPIDVDRAVQANRDYAVQLGWATRYDEIVALLGLNASPTEQSFAQAVATWQGQHALSVDGIIGPDTWAAMQPLLSSPPSPIPPSPIPPAPVPPPTPSPADIIATDLTSFIRTVSMGLTADRAATLQPPPGTGAIAVALSDPKGWTGKLTIDGSGATASAIRFPVEMNHGGSTMTMPVTVFDTLVWGGLTVADPTVTAGAGLALPLTKDFVLGVASPTRGRSGISEGTVDLFPLETEVQTYATCAFGYSLDGPTGTVTPLDLSQVPSGQLQQFLSNHGNLTPVATGRTALVAVYDLALTSPKDDFQPTQGAPMGLAEMVRAYPLLSLWSSRPLASAGATLDMTRPATSPMDGMARGGAISAGFYTDVNSGLRTLWDDTTPAMKLLLAGAGVLSSLPFIPLPVTTLIAIFHVIPSTRWNSIFAHYSLDANRTGQIVVAPRLGRRIDPSDRQAWDTESAGYLPTPVIKVERQGVFDNVHVAPVMDYQGAPAYMAPVCHHDCLHIHWRWGEVYKDKPLRGWSGGKPYQKSGAPMIPENQTLRVGVSGPRVTYAASAESAPAQAWQVFMHHGTGYVSSLTPAGEAVRLLELSQLGALPAFNAFYYHNHMLETGGSNRAADTPRLKEGAFGPLETM